MRIVNLASGSKGNSTFVEYNGTKILIDCGLSARELQKRLVMVGSRLDEINAICITHEHSDHIKGIVTLAKKYDMTFFVHKKLENYFSEIEGISVSSKLKTFECEPFEIGDIVISPFEISHDAIFPVGFVISVKGSKTKVGFATDLGIVTSKVKEALNGTKIVFLESNYDEEMLINGYYPIEVKKRIKGDHGHLSNSQSLELANWLYSGGTKYFVLSHISENNNTKELAYKTYAEFFKSQGLVLDKDIVIRLSFSDKHGNNFNIKEEF